MRATRRYATLARVVGVLVGAVGSSLDAQAIPVAVTDYAFTPATVTAPQGSTVRWDFFGPTPHTSTDETFLQLWNSGFLNPGAAFSFRFDVAGSYAYLCTIHPVLMTGTVAIPVTASPATAPLGSSLTVVWAAAPIPSGYVVDVEVDAPGPGGFRPLRTGTTAMRGTGVAPRRGVYVFRARLRRLSNGAVSAYSPTATVTVT
jgi:plastocyanin